MHRIIGVSFIIALLLPAFVLSQNGTIKGRIVNAKTNQPIEFASIQIQGTVQ